MGSSNTMDSRFPHMLAKRNVIGYRERFMDVEGRSAWTLVPMVLIAQWCVDTSRGPKAPYGGILPPYPYGGILPPYPLPWERK